MEAAVPGTYTDPSLLQRLREARALSDETFAIVRSEALYDRPIPERHRIVFYLGHLEAFDWNLLNGRLFELAPAVPAFPRRCLPLASIRSMAGCLATSRRTGRRATGLKLTTAACEKPWTSGWRPWMSPPSASAKRRNCCRWPIEHRLMHVEPHLSYMLHPASHRPQIPPRGPTRGQAAAQHNRVRLQSIKIPKGKGDLLRPPARIRRMDAFGWDNEFEEHSVLVPGFLIDERKVTNGEFLQFLRAGGYQERSFWSDDDWNWIVSSGTTHPGFWARRDNHWFLRTMFDEVALPDDWPVYVSHAEASAYARWAGLQLPSEAELQRAAYATPQGIERAFPWGDQPPDAGRGNFDCERWDATPTGAFRAGRSAYGVADLVGNGWEWTRTVFAPFDGFEPFPCYPGYSANFFDGKHYVLKGGSARTARCILRRSFRNWFQPHYPFIYSGFRCVEH